MDFLIAENKWIIYNILEADFLFSRFDLRQSAAIIRFLCAIRLCEANAMCDDVFSTSRSEISHLQTDASESLMNSKQTTESMFIHKIGKALMPLNVLISL